ncbi:MAG TPA: hypothetical protein VGD91_22195 [Trebonia sp.]
MPAGFDRDHADDARLRVDGDQDGAGALRRPVEGPVQPVTAGLER